MTVRTRFAPSPTGYLHIGGARTALFNWLYAHHLGGSFILRIEDTDQSRNLQQGTEAILSGLRWLGLDWDEGPGSGGDYGPYFQSERQEIYERHLETLRKKNLVYTEDNGAVRFKAPRKPVIVDDQICGRVEFQRDEPDMTLRRPDRSFIFHFVNVVDDLEMNITHVLRGEDHLSNTPKHIELFHALDAVPPVYAHIPLILNANGSKMSKRDLGASMFEYQEKSYLPQAVVNYLCLLGWSPKDDREILSINEVIPLFDFAHINHSNASFDLTKLNWMNGQYLARLTPDEFFALALPVISAAGLADESEERLRQIIALVQSKVDLASEIPDKIRFFFGERCHYDASALAKLAGAAADNATRLQALCDHFADAVSWEPSSISAAIDATAASLSVKKGALMFPARVAASGQAGGPDLLPMLEILGRDRVIDRFQETITLLGSN